MKRIILVLSLALIGLGFWWQKNSEQKNENKALRPLVAIIQTIEHPALDNARLGVIEGLKNQGFQDKENIDILYESAQGNPALALQIAQKFVGQNARVIVCVGTTASQAAVQATQNTKGIDIVFATVSDPIGAKLVQNLQAPEGNVTGITNYIAPDLQFDVFKKIVKPLKTIGVIYNPGEANSVAIVEKMEEAATKQDIQLIFAPATKTADVSGATQSLMGKVDAIFINNDNTALAAFDAVTKVGLEHKTPVFVSDIEIVDKGALAALGPNQIKLGMQAGSYVASILKGEKPPHDLPVVGPDKTELKLNIDIGNKLKIQFGQDLQSQGERMN